MTGTEDESREKAAEVGAGVVAAEIGTEEDGLTEGKTQQTAMIVVGVIVTLFWTPPDFVESSSRLIMWNPRKGSEMEEVTCETTMHRG